MPKRTCRQTSLPILLALAFGCMFTTALFSAEANRQDELYTLQIEPLPLEQSLQEFASQSGVQLVFFSRLTAGRNAPALHGQHSLADALDTLLSGSNLSYRVVKPGTVLIQERAQDRSAVSGATHALRTSPHVEVASDPEQVIVSASADGLTATRVETPLRAIPQTFSVLSAEQLRLQNVTTLDEALSKAPGIVATRHSSIDQGFLSRGFGVSMLHIDGSSALNAQSIAAIPFRGGPDLSEFERIEILRGADALFGADGEPGATVNLVRKRPLDRYSASVSGWLGSWNDRRLEADVTGPLMSSDRVRGRIVGVYHDHDYFFDVADLRRRKIFGALEMDATQTTRLTLGGSYQWDRATPFLGGWPLYTDGRDSHLPRRFAFAFDWSYYDIDSREIYLNLEQAFGPDWKLRIGATWLGGVVQYRYARLVSTIDPATDRLRERPLVSSSAGPSTQRQLTLDMTLTGAMEIFGRRAELALGADVARFHVNKADRVLGRFGPVLADVRHLDRADFPDPTESAGQNTALYQFQLTHLDGVFAALRVYATDALSAVGGVRLSNGHYSNVATLYVNGQGVGALTGDSRDEGKYTPYAGVVYEVDPVYSLYASYSDIYQTAAYAETLESVTLRPVDGVVWEGGIKSAWRDGTLNGALAVYRIKQSGLPEMDAQPRPPGRNSRCCFAPSGVTRSKGLDAEVSGKLTPGAVIGAGYSYNVNRDVDRRALSEQTPRHLLKVWTNARLPGTLSRWEIGGTLHAQSEISISRGDSLEGTYSVRQPAYLTLDLRAGYELSANWRASLTVGNVFDQRYYETISSPSADNWYGEPRRVLLRLDGQL